VRKERQDIAEKGPRQCVFCTNNANSPEHVWSKWMAPHFKRTAHDAREEFFQDFHPKTAGPPTRHEKHGHPTTMKLKVVCRVCNNGWMSGVESAAKPFIEPMLTGKRTRLNSEAQRAVTTWMAMKMMIVERASWTTAVFTRDQALSFAMNRSPPDNLKVSLLHSHDEFAGTRVSRGYAGLFKNREDSVGKDNMPNTQSVMFGIGQLLIFAIHSQLSDLEMGKLRKKFAKQIWPARRLLVTWPPSQTVNGEEAMGIAMLIQNYLSQPGMVPL